VPSYGQGSIVYAWVLDKQGQNPKRRPMVVINPDHTAGNDLALVGVSREVPMTVPNNMVILPQDQQTKIVYRCAAVCDWLCKVADSLVTTKGGRVPRRIVVEILNRVPSPPSWVPDPPPEPQS
jgi:hypothetical protein